MARKRKKASPKTQERRELRLKVLQRKENT